MAGGKHGLSIDGLEKWQRWLAQLEHEEVANTRDRILRKAGMQLLAHLDDLTPRRSGVLQNSFKMGDPNNVFKIGAGKTSYVFVGTAVSYAQYVNDGFTQKKGQFIPGVWKKGTFHYIPGHNKGMVLKGKVIPGARMFEKAMTRIEEDLPDILDFEFRRLYAVLFES